MQPDSTITWDTFLSSVTAVGVEAAKKALGQSDDKTVPPLPAAAATPQPAVQPFLKRYGVAIAIGAAVLLGVVVISRQ